MSVAWIRSNVGAVRKTVVPRPRRRLVERREGASRRRGPRGGARTDVRARCPECETPAGQSPPIRLPVGQLGAVALGDRRLV